MAYHSGKQIMKANVVGTGRMGRGIVRMLTKAYPGEIGLYSRDKYRAENTIAEPGIQAKALSEDEQFDAEVII